MTLGVDDDVFRLKRFAELERDLHVNINGPRKAKELAQVEFYAKQQEAAEKIQSGFRQWTKRDVQAYGTLKLNFAELKDFKAAFALELTRIEVTEADGSILGESAVPGEVVIVLEGTFNCKLGVCLTGKTSKHR